MATKFLDANSLGSLAKAPNPKRDGEGENWMISDMASFSSLSL
jgi:hypothetical protein